MNRALHTTPRNPLDTFDEDEDEDRLRDRPRLRPSVGYRRTPTGLPPVPVKRWVRVSCLARGTPHALAGWQIRRELASVEHMDVEGRCP